MEEKRFQHKKQPEQEDLKKSQIIQCSCGHENEPGALFCENCGTGSDQPKRECPFCGELNSGIYCELCGANIEGVICKQCNTLQHFAFCSGCGEPMSDIALELVKSSTESITVTEMSEQKVLSIMAELHDSLTPQMQKEQEKKRQRIILLSEREYFNEREKRIEEYYSRDNYRVININPEDMKEIKKLINRLKGFAASENKRVDEVIKERENRARAEAQARIESQAKLEAQARAKEQSRAEEQRLRKERYQDRISGIWVATSRYFNAVMKIQLKGSSVSGIIHSKTPPIERIDTFIGNWDNYKIFIKTESMKTISIRKGWINVPLTFSALVNNSGDTMNGYIASAGYWQEVFIKQ